MPELVATHAFTKQDDLLARIRYHRLIERYRGIPCYSLGTHLRANVRGLGEVEVDELYVGINGKGERFVFPVQARVAPATFDLVQHERGAALCAARFRGLRCVPIGAVLTKSGSVALFDLMVAEGELRFGTERHYRFD